MKVILIGKGKLLAHMIECAIEANVEIAGVMRYERNTLSPLKLFLSWLHIISMFLALLL